MFPPGTILDKIRDAILDNSAPIPKKRFKLTQGLTDVKRHDLPQLPLSFFFEAELIQSAKRKTFRRIIC
jgi:hypothetical protein